MSERIVFKRQVYLSDEQYTALKNGETITVDGQEIAFSENDEYITPDETATNMTALRQELLAKIQKKADTSYVDEQLEGAKKYRHDIVLTTRTVDTADYDTEVSCRFSFYSSVATAFVSVAEILNAIKTASLATHVGIEGSLYEKDSSFTAIAGYIIGGASMKLSSSFISIYGVVVNELLSQPFTLSYMTPFIDDITVSDTPVEI